MKTIHTVTKPTQFPEFWDEEWLQIAIDELERRKLTHDERASLEILIARNAEAVKASTRRIREAEQRGMEEGLKIAKQKAEQEQVFGVVERLSTQTDFTAEQIAEIVDTSLEFVLSVQEKIAKD